MVTDYSTGISDRSSRARHSVLRIRATRGWGSLELRQLWEYRDLGLFLMWREIKARYRQTALGPLWIVLKPLGTMVIYSLIFGALAKIRSDGLPYPVFSYAALLPWFYFSGVAVGSTGSLTSNMGLISKVYFPRLMIPVVAVFSGLVDFAISFVILLGLMAWYHIVPSFAVVMLPIYLMLAAATGLAVGLWLAALAARFRDVNFGLTYVLQAWQYASPVIYSSSLVLEKWPSLYPLYRLNPMANVVEGFRWALLGTGQGPDIYLAISAGLVAVALITGLYHFRSTERTIVDLQ